MGLISRTSFSTGEIPTAAEWNTQFDTVYNLVNGNIDDANIAAGSVSDANLAQDYLNLSSSTTATASGNYTFLNTLKCSSSIEVTGTSSLDGGIDTGDNIQMKFKTIEIGDWNMDSTDSVDVAHGLTLSTIRNVQAIVRDDFDASYVMLGGVQESTFPTNINDNTLGGAGFCDATNILLTRTTGGILDGTDYDSTSYNRGWITVWYTA